MVEIIKNEKGIREWGGSWVMILTDELRAIDVKSVKEKMKTTVIMEDDKRYIKIEKADNDENNNKTD